jgi:pimeloyl-ACP methyl ester carboxylesterase
MHPFYFGTSQRPLFGVYHPPHRGSDRHKGIVICYPFGQEYMRGHRAFRQLGMLLSRAGFHVLRFDYHGTGDSAGNSSEAGVSQWINDVRAAVDELKEMADLPTVSLVGTRLGAALAVEAATSRNDIETLVLWDPIVAGTDYLTEILGTSANELSGNSNGADLVGMVHGFPITRAFSNDLRKLDITVTAPTVSARIVVSSEQPAYTRLREAWPAAEFAHVPSKGNWNEVDNFGSALVPQEIIRDIVAWLEQTTRAGEAVT